MTRDDTLTPKQSAFVQEYLIDLNATQAVLRAGYSESGASVTGVRLLRNAKIQQHIGAERQARSERTRIDVDFVLTTLRDNALRAMQAEPVMVKGEATGEYQYDGHVANRALELIGKHLRMFPDRHEVTGKDGEPIQVTIADLAKVLALEGGYRVVDDTDRGPGSSGNGGQELPGVLPPGNPR